MVELNNIRSRRAAGAAMIGIFAFKVSYSGFIPPFSELLLARACESLGLPAYPAPACSGSDAASAIAADRSGYYNLATTIPQLLSISLYSMLADVRGRKPILLLCYCSGLLQMLVVWLLPAGKICLFGQCVDDSFWVLLIVSMLVSFLGSWGVALGSSFAVIADITEGASPKMRGTLFGVMEGFNIGGSIVGPLATGYLAKTFGLQQSFLFPVAASTFAVLCAGLIYVETLNPDRRKEFSWAAANPIGSMGLLTKHPILLRFLLLIIFTDLASLSTNLSTLYFTRLSGFDEEANGAVNTVGAAAAA